MEARKFSKEDVDVLEDEMIAELTERFRHRVRFFAYRVERRFRLDPQWRDDLISSGYWGLLKALRKRRADAHERELSAYVSKRVEGAIIDEARRVLNRLSSCIDRDPADLEVEHVQRSSDCDWASAQCQLDPEHCAERAARWRLIEAAVEHLDDDHRKILWAYAEGHSLSEIARSSGHSAASIQGQMTRIGRSLRARSPEIRRLLRNEL